MKNQLRPNSFKEFIGQEKIKQTIDVLIKSAIKQEKALDHILLYGLPGFGKTSFAHLIGSSLQKKVIFAQGPLIEKKSDVLSLFSSLQKDAVIFIDEIHSINKEMEELLYSALEEKVIDIMIGPDGASKMVRIKLPDFTLIGATTKKHKMSKPLLERFGFVATFKRYELEELLKIAKNSAIRLDLQLTNEALKMIALHANGTPRIINNLIKRVQDFAIVEERKIVDEKFIKDIFGTMGIYKDGLNETQVKYLSFLAKNFQDRWLSIDIIASLLSENKVNVNSELEPLLIKNNYIVKSSRGRKVTQEGINYLKSYKLL